MGLTIYSRMPAKKEKSIDHGEGLQSETQLKNVVATIPLFTAE